MGTRQVEKPGCEQIRDLVLGVVHFFFGCFVCLREVYYHIEVYVTSYFSFFWDVSCFSPLATQCGRKKEVHEDANGTEKRRGAIEAMKVCLFI